MPNAPRDKSREPRRALASSPLNLEEAETVLIQRALEQTRGNVAEAARLLGVNRSRIYRRFPQSAGIVVGGVQCCECGNTQQPRRLGSPHRGG